MTPDEVARGLVWKDVRKLPVQVRAARVPIRIVIHTLEGDMRAEPGDWLIQGVSGELYPCKPDIFAKTYEVL